MAAATSVASRAQAVLRGRLCGQAVVHAALRSSSDTNYSNLEYLVASSVSEACNNSVLLLGPRGCGKAAVVDMVLDDLRKEHPDSISVIRLNGMLHSDSNCAMKLCLEHQLSFSKMASSDDNTEFMIEMLWECGLAHKTIIFVLEEFDLFAQGKQRLLYSLLDAMQSLTSQAVVIGVSCPLDADQLLEKGVRSRFSHKKLLFVPSSGDSLQGSALCFLIFFSTKTCPVPQDVNSIHLLTLEEMQVNGALANPSKRFSLADKVYY